MVLSIFYTESHVKIRSMERAVKNMEVVGSESDGLYWSSSAVLLILAKSICLHQHTESPLGYNIPHYTVHIIHSYAPSTELSVKMYSDSCTELLGPLWRVGLWCYFYYSLFF